MPDGIPIHFGNFSYTIHFYGIIIIGGVIAGAFLSRKEAKRRGLDPDIIWDMLVYLLIGGVLGARLWHIFSPPPTSLEQGITTVYYLTHPLAAIAIWNGGLGIPGAIIGGAIAMLIYTRKHKLDFAVWADIAAPGIALGQAIGRWGNFLIRNCMVHLAPYRGQFILTHSIVWLDLPTRLTITHSFYMSQFGILPMSFYFCGWADVLLIILNQAI